MPKTFAAAAILALSLLACGGGDDGEDADGGSEADASLADYSEENCDLLLGPQIPDTICCYTGGAMAGCDKVFDIDGEPTCIDQIVDGVPMCAVFACETMVDDIAECE
jgi:hypothetical protein